METRILHSWGNRLEVSSLCLGTMNLGVRVDDETSFAILDRYYEAGGRFLDTANNYGDWTPGLSAGTCERVIGRWLVSRKVGDMVIATKSGAGKLDPDKPLANRPPTNFEGLAPKVVREQLARSLENLGVDRVDVYYGHVDDRTLDITEIADLFSALAEEGLIAIPGISNTATWRLAVARAHSKSHDRPEFGAWQQQMSAYWPKPGVAENGLTTVGAVDYATSEPDLTIFSYSPQQQGQIARPWVPFRDHYDHAQSHDRLRLVHKIAHEHGATANQVIMAWHSRGVKAQLNNPAGSSTTGEADLPELRASVIPVFGASSVEQLDEALGTLDLKLTEEQLESLDTP